MEKMWKAAFAVAGVGAIAFFVFFSLYQQWLTLPIFEKLSQSQTFVVMLTFLLLAFAALVAGLWAWLRGRQEPAAPGAIEASRDFFVGCWQVQQKSGDSEGDTVVEYFPDGRFSGELDQFVRGQGRRDPVQGTWRFTRLAKDRFRLAVLHEGGDEWTGNFRIIDRDRIHNTTHNYIAVRVVR